MKHEYGMTKCLDVEVMESAFPSSLLMIWLIFWGLELQLEQKKTTPDLMNTLITRSKGRSRMIVHAEYLNHI